MCTYDILMYFSLKLQSYIQFYISKPTPQQWWSVVFFFLSIRSTVRYRKYLTHVLSVFNNWDKLVLFSSEHVSIPGSVNCGTVAFYTHTHSAMR